MLTSETLQLAYVGAPQSRCDLWALPLAEACEFFHINTPARMSTFLAQIGHESGRLRYTKELWGPTTQQKRYERTMSAPWAKVVGGKTYHTNSLAYTLGNENPGDGKRYMGRGVIQITGAYNYKIATERLRKALPDLGVPDFYTHPEALETPRWSAMAAGEYWQRRNLNQYADEEDFAGQTKAINGGYNGLADRQLLRAAALPAVLLTQGY